MNLSARLRLPALASSRLLNVTLRAFWLLMLVGHAAPFLGSVAAALRGEPDFVRSGILGLCEFFFLLKLLDVRWLRLPRSPRVLAASVVVIGLLHADVIRQHAPQAEAYAEPISVLVTAMTLALLPIAIGRLDARRLKPPLLSQRALALAPVRPRRHVHPRRCAPNRAPPR